VAISPQDLLSRFAAGLVEELGDELLSLSVHGSWVAGDFKLGRSDRHEHQHERDVHDLTVDPHAAECETH